MTSFVRWASACCFCCSRPHSHFPEQKQRVRFAARCRRREPWCRASPFTLANVDTGETKDFVTNQDGIYDTVSTPAGNYKISFHRQGL